MSDKNYSVNYNGGIGCLFVFFFAWTDRCLDWFCTYYFGHPVDIPTFISVILNFFFGGIAFLFDIVVEIWRACV